MTLTGFSYYVRNARNRVSPKQTEINYILFPIKTGWDKRFWSWRGPILWKSFTMAFYTRSILTRTYLNMNRTRTTCSSFSWTLSSLASRLRRRRTWQRPSLSAPWSESWTAWPSRSWWCNRPCPCRRAWTRSRPACRGGPCGSPERQLCNCWGTTLWINPVIPDLLIHPVPLLPELRRCGRDRLRPSGVKEGENRAGSLLLVVCTVYIQHSTRLPPALHTHTKSPRRSNHTCTDS